MNEPTHLDAVLLAHGARLDVARRIEHTAALLRQVQARTEHGPHRRTRRRLRRQLRKLQDVLADTQRDALSTRVDVSAALGAHLDALDQALREALYAPPTKAGWRALRKELRVHRRAIAALPDAPAVAEAASEA